MASWLSRRARSGLVAAMGAIALVAGGLVGLAQPAGATPSANGTYRTLVPTNAFYIDSADVRAQLGAGAADLPVGAWRDAAGKHHVARILLTFDISALRATKIFTAYVVGSETSVNQCPNRAIDLWLTDNVTAATSWAHPPAERSLIGSVAGTPPYGCPSDYMEWGGTQVVQSAVDALKSTLTVEFRVPDAHEGDVAFGRRLTSAIRMYVHSDAAPDTPSRLSSNGQGCATGAPYPYLAGLGTFTLYATAADPDTNGGDWLDVHFAIWPVDHPDRRTEFVYQSSPPSNNPVQLRLTQGFLADGISYAWTARSDDGVFTSDWAAPCYFTADLTSPSAPTVRSTDYPNDGAVHGGAGIPGLFTFGANGSTDTVRYVYSWYPSAGQSVNAPQPGADATVSIAPPRGGANLLVVASVDRAGLISQQTTYQVYAASTAPYVSVTWPVPHPASGVTINPGPAMSGTFTFQPVMNDVVSYEYWLDNGDHHTVGAAADASAQVAFPGGTLGYHTFHVRSVTGAGLISGIADLNYTVDDAPLVSSSDYPEMDSGGGAGTPGTFTFAPKSDGVVGYAYYFNWGDVQTVDAGADGTASVQWTPDYEGFQLVSVFALYADGTYSDEYDYYFNVGPW
jgi:hypothetical protein